MIAEVIAVGDELTSGQRLDTNSQWLADKLGELGVRVLYHSTVGDELPPMVDVFRAASQRADVITCTGGLGPTADDLTREALANLTSAELEQDDAVLQHIQNIYALRNRPMPERNVIQAMFPAGSQVIPNPHGTAPGIDMLLPEADGRRARIFALPGVPAEMMEMWQTAVAPAVCEMIPQAERRVICHRRVKCFGVGESDLEAMLPNLIHRDYYPRVGITVSKATITLRVTAQERDEASCLAAMEPTLAIIRESLDDLIFGEEDDELHDVVARMLSTRGRSLATAENYTQGLLAGWLAITPEADKIVQAGHVRPKMVIAGAEEAEKLVAELKTEAGADFALLVGDEASISGQGHGEVHYAVAGDGVAISRTAKTIGHPDIRRPRIAKAALDLLRKQLIRLL